ncbi:MAG: hypothetical protein JXA35_06670 [Deltaproteobacteria bacterium]|nr:hypothetical protein [Deltaproteobacteria bacterium]
MSINQEWKKKFDVLKEYIDSNSEIYIDAREISIPEHLRDKFYEFFDDIRHTFVKDFFGSLPLDVDTLCRNYNQAEKELMSRLKLERIDLPVDLISFLHNPREGMVRWLYNRLFEVIQGKIKIEDFEQIAENDLVYTTEEMYRLGYEAWAIFTIILSLEPDETCSVELDEDYKPIVGTLTEVAFGRQFNHSTKRIPEFVIHSNKLNCYVAVKAPLAKEVEGYYLPHEIPKKMLRDRTGDTSYVLDSRILFLSRLKGIDDIPVYAEIAERKIESPDTVVEFFTEDDLNNKEKISRLQIRTGIMKPKLGSNIMVMNPGEKGISGSSTEGIDIFLTGFDKDKFQPVIEKLQA